MNKKDYINTIHIYVAKHKIYDVMGRIDYISSPERQKEKLVMTAGNEDLSFWKQLQKETISSTKNNKKNKNGIAAIELIVALPNKMLSLPIDKQREILNKLVLFIQQITGTECLIGLHDSHKDMNNKDGNCHAHILISERPLLAKDEIKYAERKYYLDETGKRKFRYSEILDNSGNIRPGCSILPKGSVWKMFGSKYGEISTDWWLDMMKDKLADWVNVTCSPDKKRKKYTDNSPYIPYTHISKKVSSDKKQRIEKDNEFIKEWNEYIRSGVVSYEEAMYFKPLIMLSPVRSFEAINCLNAIDYEDGVGNVSPAFRKDIGRIDRTYSTDIIKESKRQKLREEFRLAHIERTLMDEAQTDSEYDLHRKNARHHSANIDRLRKELGYWTDSDFLRKQSQAEKELKRLQRIIANTKYNLYMYRRYGDDDSRRLRDNSKIALAEYIRQEQRLSREISNNRKIISDNGKLDTLSFDEMVNSAQLRYAEAENARYAESKEAYFGKSIGSIGFEKELLQSKGIRNISDLRNYIQYNERTISKLKSSIDLATDILKKEERTRQAVIQYESTIFAVRLFNKAKTTDEKNIIKQRYKNELQLHNTSKNYLAKQGILTDKDIIRYKQKYNRVLNDRHLNGLRIQELEKELEELEKIYDNTNFLHSKIEIETILHKSERACS